MAVAFRPPRRHNSSHCRIARLPTDPPSLWGFPPMTGLHPRRVVAAALAATLALGGLSRAAEPTPPAALPKPAEVRALEASPAKLALKGGDDAPQLVVTAALTNGRLQDLSGDV